MKNQITFLKRLLITLDLNQLKHHRKMNTLLHSRLTYMICCATSNLREWVQNSQINCQKISNALMKTRYFLFLLTKQTTCISYLRIIITNYWQTTSQNHTKKTDTAAINNINKEAKCIAERVHFDDRVEQFNQREGFVTLKDHMEKLQNNPKCRLLKPAKSEIGIISKHYIEKINSNIRKTTNMNQWQNAQAVRLDWNSPCRGEGAFHQEVSTQMRQQGELNWASQLKSSDQQIFSTMSSPEPTLITQDWKGLL